MNYLVPAAVVAALVSVTPVATGGPARFFLGGGPTGTSAYGFRGGWGLVLGLERPIAESGALLVRADLSAVPATAGVVGSFPRNVPLGTADLGRSGPRAADATLLSLMAGLRLKSAGRLRCYLDALLGVGHLNDPATTPSPNGLPPGRLSRDRTNVALSFGSGVELRTRVPGTVFADVHYDFFFVEAATTPIIPVRIGLAVR